MSGTVCKAKNPNKIQKISNYREPKFIDARVCNIVKLSERWNVRARASQKGRGIMQPKIGEHTNFANGAAVGGANDRLCGRGEIVPVYMSCDDNYAIHLCVVAASIVANTSSRVHFIVLYSKLSDSNKSRIAETCAGHKVDFVCVDAIAADLDGISFKCAHISIAACYRYFIPRLPFDYDKGVYLDCDVIVRGDIRGLFDFDLGDAYIAGAEDFIKPSYLNRIGLRRYFNSGVLLLNIERMRRENIAPRLLAATVANRDKFRYLDQDVLNTLLGAESKFLPVKWGAVSSIFRKREVSEFVAPAEIAEAVRDPQILHFTGPDKPWIIPRGILAHPWTPAYFYYLRRTPFAGEEARICGRFNPMRRFFWYLSRHPLFFMRPQFFKMRLLYAKNRAFYENGVPRGGA